MRQWAISVGINQYQFFQPLSYAQQDAQAIRQFLVDDIKLPAEQCVLLTETSPPQWDKSTYPDHDNIQRWLDFIIERCVQPGDILWFFFSGYGICQQGQDYLVPIEGNPAAIQTTAVPLETIFRSLRRASAATVLVLLDINRNESSFSYETVGDHTVHLASITGIPTLLSCQPGQFSRETSALGHGFFTAALLESLRSRKCTTVAALEQDLNAHLPELSEHYWRPVQQPVTICPAEKQQLPLLATASATYPVSDRTTATQTAKANGTAFSTATQTIDSADALGSVGGAHGNGHWSAATTATVTLAAMEFRTANSEVGTGGGNPKAPTVSAQRDFNGSANTSYSTNGVTAPTQSNGVGTRYPIDTAAKNHENGVTHSDRADTVTQPNSDYPDDVNEITDALFWRSVLRWGGLAVVGLILGVLLRNHAAFTPKSPATAQQPTTSSKGQAGAAEQIRIGQTGTGQLEVGQANTRQVPALTKPSGAKSGVPASPTSIPVVKPISPQPIASTRLGASGASRLNVAAGTARATPQPTQPTGTSRTAAASTTKMPVQSHLAKARALASVNNDQASPYWYAIQEAKHIQPGQPEYAQAKQDIALWSRQILSIARQRGRQGSFDAAIVAARLVPQDQPAYAEAKSAIDRWCPALKSQRGINPVQRQQAKDTCRNSIS